MARTKRGFAGMADLCNPAPRKAKVEVERLGDAIYFFMPTKGQDNLSALFHNCSREFRVIFRANKVGYVELDSKAYANNKTVLSKVNARGSHVNVSLFYDQMTAGYIRVPEHCGRVVEELIHRAINVCHVRGEVSGNRNLTMIIYLKGFS